MRRWMVVIPCVLGLILVSLVVQADDTFETNFLRGASRSPVISQSAQSPTDDWVPYGTTYVWSGDFSDLEGLRARLEYVHSLGVRTLIQMHSPNAPLSERRCFLDEAHALGMRVIVRLSGTTSDPPWSWDGESFDLTPLETFLSDGIADHPALLAIYGFHIPWHDFAPDEIQQFYSEFHAIAGDISLYHDLVWINETPESALLPGMCDLCEISSMPHTWHGGSSANNTLHITEKVVRYTSHIRQADPSAQVWIQAQTFQRTPDFRMPTDDDMLWHADLLMEYVDFDGLLWYPYLHAYEHQLGDADMEAQRQTVRTVYHTYYSTPTNWIIIDHNAVDAAVIPQVWLDQARVLDTFFTHKSVGNNILDGMTDLQTQNPDRYTIAIYYGGCSWFSDNDGICHSQPGSNYDPQSKIDGFESLIRSSGCNSAQVAMMKFCPSDVPPLASMPAADSWVAYRDMMEGLEQDYPDVTFVWWTFPLSTASDNRGNDEHAVFNSAVRDYCAYNGYPLFDIADIESHDPSGNPITGPTGHEAMWDGYAYDGAHLNETGRQRVARAMWWLLARVAGWTGTSDWISVAAVTDVASIYPAETVTYTLSVTASEGFTAPVTLTLEGAPSDAIVSFDPNPVTPPGASQLCITTTASIVAGTYVMTVTGTSGEVSGATHLTLTVNPVTLNLVAQPEVRTVLPGDTAVYTLSVTASEDLTTPVILTLQGEPSGATVSIAPNPITPPGASQLYITTTASTVTGTHVMTVTGTSGQVTDTTSLTLTINPAPMNPVLSLTAHPGVHTILPGNTAAYTLSVTASEGLTTPVILTLQGAPSGTTVSFNPNPVTPPGNSQLYITTTASTVARIYMMTVTGTSGVLTTTANLTLIVISATPRFTLSVLPSERTAEPNQIVSYTAVITGINGFNQPITLMAVGLPTSIGTAWSVNPVTPGNSSILTLSVPSNPPFGRHPFHIVGETGTLITTEGIELIITYFKNYLPIILK